MLYIFLLFICTFAGLLILVFGVLYALKSFFTGLSPKEDVDPVYSVGFDSVKEKYYIREGKKRIRNWFGFTVYYDNKAKALYYVAKLNGDE